MRILPLAEAKAKLSQLVTDVSGSNEEITITRNGRAAAVLISYDDFESWRDTVEVMSDPAFLADVRSGIAALGKGLGTRRRAEELDELFAEPKPSPRRRKRG